MGYECYDLKTSKFYVTMNVTWNDNTNYYNTKDK